VTLAPDATSPLAQAADCTTTGNGSVRAGPEMVRIDAGETSYCIDTTEVTVADYNAFVVATGGGVVDTPDLCDTAAPGPLADNTPDDQRLPVGNVGPCNAWSYCSWAGKRLCGMVGDGGPIEGTPALETTEWGYACFNGSYNYAYPYGAAYQADVCNTDDPDGGPVAVTSMTGCHGVVPPFDRIYDMVGNAWELVNDLENAAGNVDAHGGSWTSLGDVGCGENTPFNGLIYNFQASGFRCCADP
jgi:formylglycine-generating enzyme required for sulfatase activity